MGMTRGALCQAVVLCGGLGTRLGPAAAGLPKVLVPIGGQPFLARLLGELARAGTEEVLLLTGHGGDEVLAAASALSAPGLRVEALAEPAPRGTAGSLHAAADRLAERFLLLFGDVYAPIDWRRFARAADERAGLGTLLVHRTDHPDDSDVLALDDARRIVAWAPRGSARSAAGLVTGSALGNAAVAAWHRDLLGYVPRDRPCDLYGELVPALVDARAPLSGYTSSEYVRDFGTPARLQEVDADVRAGRTRLRAEVALLDRDGVLTDERAGPATRPDDLRLLPGAARGVRLLGEAGIRTALVTNQAVVARGRCTLEGLDAIHARLGELLAAEGAALDLVLACPHHPETLHAEGPPALRGPCACRKPRTGLVERALRELAGRPFRSVVVGDGSIDMQLAHNAGIASIALDTGKGGRDTLFPARPTWRFADLAAAAHWLAGER